MKILDQGVQNYMFYQSKYIWIINLMVFIAVVVLGINQAGKAAEISFLEKKLDQVAIEKRELSEKIFTNDNNDKIDRSEELGYIKPSKVLYFNSIDVVASR